MGVGGGGDDLERDAELAVLRGDDEAALMQLYGPGVCEVPDRRRGPSPLTRALRISRCRSMADPEREELKKAVASAFARGRGLSLNVAGSLLDGAAEPTDAEGALCALSRLLSGALSPSARPAGSAPGERPKVIQFPYSRHSSYPELCHLLQTFRPRDVWPCTVDAARWLDEGKSIESLFGRFCCGQTFAHDDKMAALAAQHVPTTATRAVGSSSPVLAEASSSSLDHAAPERHHPQGPVATPPSVSPRPNDGVGPEESIAGSAGCEAEPDTPTRKRKRRESDERHGEEHSESQQGQDSPGSTPSSQHAPSRTEAYRRMLHNAAADDGWVPIALLSTDGNHSVAEAEL
ncbi:hypothetical protein CDD83_4857 [Cordyceps sp. RAO-2017]|nr:hypothetical protein CDD83_4857 [Cordyceps sp. RAO-2017]